MDDDLIPHGYSACRCGAWVLAGRKMCDDCASTSVADETAVLDVDGKPVLLMPRTRKRRPTGDGTGDRGMERRARDRARTRAWIRLARIYEPMFAALYIEEQLREGLEPVDPPPMAQDPFAIISRDLDEYRERLEATFTGEEPTIPDQRPAQPPA